MSFPLSLGILINTTVLCSWSTSVSILKQTIVTPDEIALIRLYSALFHFQAVRAVLLIWLHIPKNGLADRLLEASEMTLGM
jgi:hypothetical protein